jgi:hypothetical protein
MFFSRDYFPRKARTTSTFTLFQNPVPRMMPRGSVAMGNLLRVHSIPKCVQSSQVGDFRMMASERTRPERGAQSGVCQKKAATAVTSTVAARR